MSEKKKEKARKPNGEDGGDNSKSVYELSQPIRELEKKIEELKGVAAKGDINVSKEIKEVEGKIKKLSLDSYSDLTTWQRIQLAREKGRPYSSDYIEQLTEDFIEIHGDRGYADDAAVVCGLAKFEGRTVAIIGQQKGRDTKENLRRNFAMMHPEGYRKALRVMRLADKFAKPILIFIDTPGAYPGIGAEERGQAEAIAMNIREMFNLRVPVIATIIGEGGSGGALGIGVADAILMLENAYYSVISPEGCAAILWRTAEKAQQAAEALRLSAGDLKRMGICDEIIAEVPGGVQRGMAFSVGKLRVAIRKWLAKLQGMDEKELGRHRYEKYRRLGVFSEGGGEKAADGAEKAPRKKRRGKIRQ